MATKDESNTSLGNSGHGFFNSQDQLTTTDAYRLAQQVKNLCEKVTQVMVMRGQKSSGQVLEGPDYNKEAISTIEQCSQIIGSIASKGEALTTETGLRTNNQPQSQGVHSGQNETQSFKIR